MVFNHMACDHFECLDQGEICCGLSLVTLAVYFAAGLGRHASYEHLVPSTKAPPPSIVITPSGILDRLLLALHVYSLAFAQTSSTHLTTHFHSNQLTRCLQQASVSSCLFWQWQFFLGGGERGWELGYSWVFFFSVKFADFFMLSLHQD